MAAEAEALGRCTACGRTYAVYRNDGDWCALGTDGSCRCGNNEFAVLTVDVPTSLARSSRANG